MIKAIEPKELARRWGSIVDKIDNALKHGAGSTDSHLLFCQCLAGQAVCWIEEDEYGSIKAVAITRIEHYDNFSAMCIVACWATKEYYRDFLHIVEDCAYNAGCKRVVIHGRKGWVRQLKQFGYEEPYVTVMKEV